MPDKIVNMLKVMEREAKPVPGSFKVVEQLSHPEDYQKLVNNYMEENKRTVEKVRWHTERIVRERWWRWTLLHPDLGPDRIHPSRSMPSPPSLSYLLQLSSRGRVSHVSMMLCVVITTHSSFPSQRTSERSRP